MSRGELSVADVTLHMDLLTWPVARWGHTEWDDKTERLWLRLCCTVLEGIRPEMLEWLRGVDPPHEAPSTGDLPSELKTNGTNLLVILRVGQRYWGLGVTAGTSLAEIGVWAGNLDIGATISALRHLTHLIRHRDPDLECELFRHGSNQASRRIDSWLGSISPSGAEVLVRRFGLHGQPRATLSEVATSRGVSRERVRQIEARALRRLGPAASYELQEIHRGGSRTDALCKAFRSLSERPGMDVHSTDELLNKALYNEAWWPCGTGMLSEDLAGSTAHTERQSVREWLTQVTDAIWLDAGANFMKRRSENRSPYITAARKLLAVHEAVPISVVHEALLETWRSELWPECMLSVDWLGAFLRGSTLVTEGDWLVRKGQADFSNELSQSEQQLLAALQELGGVGSLDELRRILPGLRGHGSTLNQMLYDRTPIIQHIGPSIFGIRGASHDPERVAALEDLALRNGHPWIDRGGWKRDGRRKLQYRIPTGNALPSRIRLPGDITDALSDDGGLPDRLIWRTPDGLDNPVGVHVAAAGIYLTEVRWILEHLHASGGDTINVTLLPDEVWAVELTEEPSPESILIRMGRGWTSVVL